MNRFRFFYLIFLRPRESLRCTNQHSHLKCNNESLNFLPSIFKLLGLGRKNMLWRSRWKRESTAAIKASHTQVPYNSSPLKEFQRMAKTSSRLTELHSAIEIDLRWVWQPSKIVHHTHCSWSNGEKSGGNPQSRPPLSAYWYEYPMWWSI